MALARIVRGGRRWARQPRQCARARRAAAAAGAQAAVQSVRRHGQCRARRLRRFRCTQRPLAALHERQWPRRRGSLLGGDAPRSDGQPRAALLVLGRTGRRRSRRLCARAQQRRDAGATGPLPAGERLWRRGVGGALCGARPPRAAIARAAAAREQPLRRPRPRGVSPRAAERRPALVTRALPLGLRLWRGRLRRAHHGAAHRRARPRGGWRRAALPL
mmetsp:Transcript_47072/g.112869  ORF Transcript_47072/g.112869 Transcript_47072/m.112869 type:complete len:218 (-) Transcript_47072:43-696(-)